MACTPAPSCAAVRKQATKLWPDRSQASDGICASPKHSQQSPSSDHEPHVVINGVAYATAVDLTDDKAHGCDADAWADWLVAVRDKRVKYLIRNREMASSYPARGYPAWAWRPYTGANPHASHSHLSVLPDAMFDTAPWFPQLIEGDDLTPEEHQWLGTVHHHLADGSAYRKQLEEIHDALFKGVPGYGVAPMRDTVNNMGYNLAGFDLPNRPSTIKKIMAKLGIG